MTTILVTGGAGYIGTHTDVELLNKGYDVVCVDNYSNSSPKALDRVEEITGKTVKRYEGDVRDEALMDRIFTENDIDWVIHFASLKSVGESVAKPIEYYDNNLNSTIVLLKAMRAHDVKKVIFSSSATVYGTPKELPLTEESQIGGTTNPYGTTKFFEEQILRDVHVADDSWTVVILRYFNPVGAHESGLIGEDPKGIPANLTPYIAKVALGELKEVQVFGDDYDAPDGTGVRDEVAIGPKSMGHSEDEAYQTADRMLEQMNLTRFAKANPYTLSGGEKRRLSVASMLAAAPKVLVMDEPTFGQDFSTWTEMVKLIAAIRDQGSCVIMVTHDEALVDALGARRVMFEETRA